MPKVNTLGSAVVEITYLKSDFSFWRHARAQTVGIRLFERLRAFLFMVCFDPGISERHVLSPCVVQIFQAGKIGKICTCICTNSSGSACQNVSGVVYIDIDAGKLLHSNDLKGYFVF